ncbi:hypothetical protein [Stenoxybacter acetivorans]|nr:hypothetical protein [Stenoxybacter acetivorans]
MASINKVCGNCTAAAADNMMPNPEEIKSCLFQSDNSRYNNRPSTNRLPE